MSETIVNKVAESGLVTLDLAEYLPRQPILSFDLKDQLFMGLILKEKDFREALKGFDWSVYQDQYVAVFCSADAIIPAWAYMLVTTYLQPMAKDIYVGDDAAMRKHLFLKNISSLDVHGFSGRRVVIKGCGDDAIEGYAYAEVTKVLLPVVRSLMYGEPCSTVPVFKKK